MIFETPEDVLEHFGVKGMQWGVRTARVKEGASRAKTAIQPTARAVGRGAQATGKFAWEHKKGLAMIAAGTVAAAIIIKGSRGGRHISDAEIRRLPRALRMQGRAKPTMRDVRNGATAVRGARLIPKLLQDMGTFEAAGFPKPRDETGR